MTHLPLIHRVLEHGERIAIRSAEKLHTYADLLQQSEAMARELLADREDLQQARVAFLVPAGADYIITQWGIWRAGGVAVPLSLSATEKELAYTLTDSQATIVVTTRDQAGKLSDLCETMGIRLVEVTQTTSTSSVTLPQITADRRAMILYTSGTTSTPKGVVTTHRCIQAQIESLITAWHWQADDRIPLFLPLHHIHGIINVMSCALWTGAQIESFPRFDLTPILSRVAEGAYTVFMAVPTIYVKLIDALQALAERERQPIVEGFANMRLMVSGSAALPATVHKQWTALTRQKLLERYGMTEIGMALSNPYLSERRPGAVGQPLPGVTIRLCSEQGAPIDDEEVAGEIQVQGTNVFHEYWNRPDATRESFVDGWFRTGDIAMVEDGYYRIMGRQSVDIIKSGGYKLSALEIEAALLDHPAIAACAVVGIPDATWGEVVAAAVVLQADTTLDLDGLQDWCKDRISHYKVPRRLLTVAALPRNAMGKVTKPDVSTLFTTTSE